MSMSLWRKLLYEQLARITLKGQVLDLGGYYSSFYHTLFKGEHIFVTANLDTKEQSDYAFDFEGSFPVEDQTVDHVVCINVLEHIFKYQNVLNESHRILAPGGTMVIAVPFLIRVHPSPNDYWRYTEDTLHKICTEAGFKTVDVEPIGTGVFGAAYSLRHNLYRVGLLQRLLRASAVCGDAVLSWIAPRSTFTTRNYPLGYLVVATK